MSALDVHVKQRQIWGNGVVLVPYSLCHVEKYHSWMTSAELQYLTASEPLTLEEEYAMQVKWINDVDKCTFIVLDRAIYESSLDEMASMIGDTNIFFADPENLSSAEIEVMIAEKGARGKGKGGEVLKLMMRFAGEEIGVERFEAKIKYDNVQSIGLFSKLGYLEISRSDIFSEITFLFDRTNKHNFDKLITQTNHRVYRLLNQ